MNPEPQRSLDHQRVIALLQEAQPPPSDAETPNIPEDILERLRGQYGRAPRRVITDDTPSVWAWIRELLNQPRFAFAAAVLLSCAVAGIVLPTLPSESTPSPSPPTALMRGGRDRPAAVPVYWLQSEAREPAPTGLGLPRFIVVPADEPLPKIEEALVFDPSRGEARGMRRGVDAVKIKIADPSDSNEWLSAHRQLSKLPPP